MGRNKASPLKRPITSWEKAPQLMETKYAALLIGISAVTLRRMARDGEIPAKKMGPRLWRFEKSALMEWAGVKAEQ